MTETNTDGSVESLIRDLIVWLGENGRPYEDVMDAWRTSCPRLTVWEDAVERGYVSRCFEVGRGAIISATEKGRAFAKV